MRRTVAVLIAAGGLALIALNCSVSTAADDLPSDYKLLYEQNCEKPEAMKDFVFTDPMAWRIGKDKEGNAGLELFRQSKYTPKNRSPLNIAVIRGQRFGDFRLDVEVMSTKKPYPHQDMCLFFSIEGPQKYNYAHLGLRQDAVAHRVLRVNDAPREVIPTEGSKGVEWGLKEWHKIRLERKASDGTIRVFFDDMTKPVQTANDKTFGVGYVGFGTFDDVGMIRNIKIYGTSAEKGDADFFKAAK